ncbi:MAG TPA: DUF3343 domain-containing protein [Planctomycetota bacterium]|nr:DUF3343 domain-containing protein [Planctomycetota bacterium]HRR79181.1 DUF3343 domain-containing protein [Planctomycetota bacterium]HRT93980.1 DUF3343 domain-containing protein [Planctomycetota bacterium]
MRREARVLLTFKSIHHVLEAEKALLAAGLRPDLVPVPREISANCGMAITIALADRARALDALAPAPPLHVLDDWRP